MSIMQMMLAGGSSIFLTEAMTTNATPPTGFVFASDGGYTRFGDSAFPSYSEVEFFLGMGGVHAYCRMSYATASAAGMAAPNTFALAISNGYLGSVYSSLLINGAERINVNASGVSNGLGVTLDTSTILAPCDTTYGWAIIRFYS